jgi:hypothetical protein
MKVKTNVRAGKGGADNVLPEDVSGQKQKQKGGSTNNTVVSYVPPVSRCVGL